MKYTASLALTLITLSACGCAQTGLLRSTQDRNIAGVEASEFLELSMTDIRLIAVHHTETGLKMTTVPLDTPASHVSGSTIEFTVDGGNQLVMVALGPKHRRASTTLALPGEGARRYRLNSIHEGNAYRFLVWDISRETARGTLVADVMDTVAPTNTRPRMTSNVPEVTDPGTSAEGLSLNSFW